jgi:NADPH-dependent curcumin reductase
MRSPRHSRTYRPIVHSSLNRQVWLRSRPTGIPRASDFGLREVAMPPIADAAFLVRNEFLSADPAMRGWITDRNNCAPPVEIGDTVRAFAAGVVIESRNDAYAIGDRVMGLFGWQEYAAAAPAQVWRKVGESDLSLGVLGLNGLTAYFGLLDVLRPVAGETVVVSTAAGSVGSAVGQIAKIKGCRTIGVAGGPEKVRQCIEEFGYDAAIDYKRTDDLETAPATNCRDGVDAFFDNTSGTIHDAVLAHINLHVRIAICGTASYPNWEPWHQGPRPERHLLVKRATMRGFLTADYAARFDEAISELAGRIRDGCLTYREDIYEGIDTAPASIEKLYSGHNTGKLILRV